MASKLYLNNAHTILAIDAPDGDTEPSMDSALLQPMYSGRAVPDSIAHELLKQYGGTWVTQRGIKRFPRPDPEVP